MGNVQRMTVNYLPDGGNRMCEVPWSRKGLNCLSKKKQKEKKWLDPFRCKKE